ncbi:hypothetical protein Anas_01704, partial [Armadillidium nasatum]
MIYYCNELFGFYSIFGSPSAVCSFHFKTDVDWSLAEGEQKFPEWISKFKSNNNNFGRSRTVRASGDGGEYDIRTGCSKPNSNQPENRVDTSIRLKALREKLLASSFDAIIIPSSDEHQNEYVAPSDKRREFITGFTGSSGTAVVTKEANTLWTDSRYTLQADQQVDCSWKIITKSLRTVTPPKWLTEQLAAESKVGGDIRLFGAKQWIEATKALN